MKGIVKNIKIGELGLLILVCVSCSNVKHNSMERCNKTLLETIDDTLDFLNNDYLYETCKGNENYLDSHVKAKKIIEKLGDGGFIKKPGHIDELILFKQNNVITDEKTLELYAEKFKVFVSRDVKNNNNDTLILGCGRGAPIIARNIEYHEMHLHKGQDTIDICPGMNPDIIADLSQNGFVDYLNSINKRYEFVETEGLCPPLYHELVQRIAKILSSNGKFIVSREYAFKIFLSKLGKEFKIVNLVENKFDKFDEVAAESLVSKIKNKHPSISINLNNILKKWKTEVNSIKSEILYPLEPKKEKNESLSKLFLQFLFQSFLINSLEDFFVNSKLYLGIPIIYSKNDDFNYYKTKARITCLLKDLAQTT